MEGVLTVVGGGVSALAFITNFVEMRTFEDSRREITIFVVDKSATFGPGVAYSDDLASNILNTKAGKITIHHGCPGDFYQWLLNNEHRWKKRFPSYVPAPDDYPPRPLFGLYLSDRFADVVRRGITKNVKVVQVSAEVVDIIERRDCLLVRTDCQLEMRSDYVFLACGTLPFASSKETDNPRTFVNPYPIEDLCDSVEPDASVGVIGARLSAIDAVIGLIESGHRGKITMYSRSGYLPAVRGTQGRFDPKFLTREHIQQLWESRGPLRLTDLVALFIQETTQLTREWGGGEVPKELPVPPDDPVAFLEEELDHASGARAWQAVLYATNSIVDTIWRALAEEDRVVFMERYLSLFLSFRVSIPAENARKILSYLRSNQLEFVAGKTTVSVNEQGLPRVECGPAPGRRLVCHDYVVYALGAPRSIPQMQSSLMNNLLERGCVVSHRHGGIQVDNYTYQVIGEDGTRHSRLYALGEMTSGEFFFMSAVDIAVRHARNCVMRLPQPQEHVASSNESSVATA